tara:strand:- start:628 stop:909 length:282 start_codon:yes stop_codon:yes gene_type:complete
MKIKPVNRQLMIEPIQIPKGEGKKSEVLLPDDYKPQKEQYKLCRILEVAEDCMSSFQPNTLAIVNAPMVEKIQVLDDIIHLVLENHVVGIVDE